MRSGETSTKRRLAIGLMFVSLTLTLCTNVWLTAEIVLNKKAAKTLAHDPKEVGKLITEFEVQLLELQEPSDRLIAGRSDASKAVGFDRKINECDDAKVCKERTLAPREVAWLRSRILFGLIGTLTRTIHHSKSARSRLI